MPRKSKAQEQEQRAAREPGDEPEREPLPAAAAPASRQQDEREPASPLRPWKHDNVAGVERLNYTDAKKKIFEFWLRFRDGKPSDKIRQYMKDNGFHWEPEAPKGGHWPDADGAWVRTLGLATKSQDRLQGERVFDKVVEMIYAEKGITAPQKTGGVPF